ncbi:MAG: FAD-dependent thymidylate synthase [Armatimonadetes bacterium]|nr:FAD-dependent thymidylate synthase [Armatimonadota bacterium]
MKVTQVALCPTDASTAAGRPALTPELLAATGARYSRSNDGLDAIIDKIDPQNLDKSVDSIFKMIDYGHQSIADMAPVAMFMDGVSMWLAYHIWSLCPLAGGQESSTRYIKLSSENLPDAADIGIPKPLRDEWTSAMKAALDAYETALQFWEGVARENPAVTRIPASLLNDSSEKAQKTVARMRRNYAFDRARYFLPAALKTNVMMVQSARAWVSLCQNLLSHPLPEAQQLGNLIRDELALAAPRLLKHATAKESFQKGIADWRERLYYDAVDSKETDEITDFSQPEDPKPHLEVFLAPFASHYWFERDLAFHDNRYSFIGEHLQNTAVRFGWEAVAFGDIRDLNRHRTGSKWCWLYPQGFYGANDQKGASEALAPLYQTAGEMTKHVYEGLFGSDWTFVYWILLGTQFRFEHTTTADKFIYEAELRTGVGAHYRYAQHLHDVLELWYEKFPATRGLILEGSAEPE